MNNRRTLFISLISLITILACVIPGLPTASAPALVPTTDTGILSTMVAETVSAAIALTEQAFPTPTLVPTSTPTSEPTFTPTLETVGSTLTVQDDGSTLFIDERAGYEIMVPAGWLAVRVNEQEYLDAFTLAPEIQPSLLSIQNNDPNTFRLFAIDTQDGHVLNEFFTNMDFVWDGLDVVLLEDDDILKARAILLANTVPGLEILSTKFSTTSNGVLIAFIELKSTIKNSSDTDIVVFQKQAIFNVRTGTMTVTVSTVEGLKEATFSALDAMLETLKISAE